MSTSLRGCPYAGLRHARNAPDYPMKSGNQNGEVSGEMALGRPMEDVLALCARL